MLQLYNGKHWNEYHRIEFFDKQADDLPDTTVDGLDDSTLRSVFGSYGIVVAPMEGIAIDVTVCEGEGKPLDMFLVGEGDITVGNEGLLVGYQIAQDLEHIPWEPGTIHVSVYMDTEELWMAKKVTFIVKKLD